jgi:hypothetical protein
MTNELELDRRDRNYEVLNRLIDGLQELSVFPSLVWLWTWDIVKDKLDYYSPESGEEYVTNANLTEKDVFDMFWEDADKNGFSLEYGAEDLSEAVFDWMLEREIIVVLEEDGWLDEPDNSDN